MNVKDLPDEDLAIYVREVDLEAYREIINRYEVPLLRYAQLLVGNMLTAHELVQKAFIDGYRNIHSFSSRSSFSTFIYRELHNELSIYFQKNHKSIGSYEEITEEFLSEDDAEQEFADKQLMEHIKKHLHKLPLKFKEAVVLHFIARKSYDEVSEILQIPASSVSARIGIGKHLIKTYA